MECWPRRNQASPAATPPWTSGPPRWNCSSPARKSWSRCIATRPKVDKILMLGLSTRNRRTNNAGMTNPHSFAARSSATLSAGLFSTILNRARKFLAFAALLVLAAVAAGAAEEHPFLHPLFCDHAVLQRGVPVPVWGWSAPESKVTVTFARQSRTAITGTDGKWLVEFKSMRASSEPRVLSVTNPTTHESAVVSDVLVGDVWLCSGQSNMEMGVGACNATNDIAAANFPLIRLLTVPRRIATQPVETMQCRWLPCSPDNIKQGLWGGFS